MACNAIQLCEAKVSKQKLTKRQTQAQKTKSTIYKAAMQLMDKKGFSNTTIEEISKKAKVSVGTFYLYYKSKDDIFQELYHKADSYFKNEVSSHLANKEAFDQIIVFFQHYAKYLQARGLEAISHLYNSKNKLFIAKDRYMLVLLKQIVDTGRQRGELLLNTDAQDMADYLFILARGTAYDWCLHDGQYDLEQAMTRNISRLEPLFKAKN
jgi:AcrR family transcriptional regulator